MVQTLVVLCGVVSKIFHMQVLDIAVFCLVSFGEQLFDSCVSQLVLQEQTLYGLIKMHHNHVVIAMGIETILRGVWLNKHNTFVVVFFSHIKAIVCIYLVLKAISQGLQILLLSQKILLGKIAGCVFHSLFTLFMIT